MIFGQVMTIFKLNPDPRFRFLCEHGAWRLAGLTLVTTYNTVSKCAIPVMSSGTDGENGVLL